MLKSFYKTILTALVLFSLPLHKVLAQTNLGANDLVDSGLGTRDVVGIVNNIISIFLGFLAIIAVLLIIYAGWLWMTSQGNADQIQRAKLMMVSAVIGLVIILASYAIARFVIRNLADATGANIGNEGPGGGGGPGPLPVCDEPADPDQVQVCRVRPANGVPGQYITIQGWHFGTYNITNSHVFFESTGGSRIEADLATCSGSPYWRESGTSGYYNIRTLIPLVDPGDYKIIVQNGAFEYSYPAGLDYYTVGSGSAGPGIACITPENPAPGDNITIEGNNFGNSEDTITMKGWVGSNEQDIDFTNIGSWTDTLITNAQVPVNALASDLFVEVSGTVSNDYYLAVSCSENGQCTSGCCASNVCRPDSWCSEGGGNNGGPQINYLSPDTAAEGNLITVYGSGFGDSQGTGNVWFTDSSGSGQTAGLNPSSVNASCGDNWHDNYIVVVVPDGVLDNSTDVWVEIDDGQESNQATFHDNGDDLPGLCQLSPATGAYGQSVSLSGINFNAGDRASFGGALDNSTTISSPTQAQATVPNLSAGDLGLSMQTSAGVSGNALPFNIDPTAGGNPQINEVTPDSGPIGQYLTIFGANFGNNPGTVNFIDSSEHLADIDFPNQCSTNYWRNDRIVVKVPSGLAAASNIQVVRNDLAVSNQYGFSLTGGSPGPGICAITPDNGPVNLTPVTIYGDNFGSGGTVNFYDNVSAPINIWTRQQISTIVPTGAITGPLSVITNSQTSNPVNFAVGSCSNDSQCSGGDVCCSSATGNYCAANCPSANSCSYSWTVTTGAAAFDILKSYQCQNNSQSPSPWPDGLDGFTSQDSYIDSQITAKFTRNVVDSDLLDSENIKVFKCTGLGLNCTSEVAGELSIINHNSQQEGFKFDPTANLEPDTWYQVQLGLFHVADGGETWNGPSFIWNFKTRTESVLCEVSNIIVSPDENFNVGQLKNFYASAVGDNCNICGSNYTWNNWQVTYDGAYPNDKVTIVSQNTSGNTAQVLVRGLESTENAVAPAPNYIEVRSSLGGFTDLVQSVITDQPLRIIDYGPNCGNACPNGTVWIDFNTPLNPAVVNDSLFSIVSCGEDPDCSSPGVMNYAIDYDSTNYRVILRNLNLRPYLYYSVNISAAVENVSGYSLQPANDFNWTFKTGSGDNCSINRVEVTPGNYLTNSVSPINYTAHPYSIRNECREAGLPLDPNDYSWSWLSANNSIATVGGAVSYREIVRPVNNIDGQTMIRATETVSGIFGQGLLRVNTTSGGGNNDPDNPRITDHQPSLSPVCTNAAVTVTFSEVMNRSSLRSNFKLYYQELDIASRNGNCHDIWCPTEANYSFVELPGGTQVILQPRQVMDINSPYLAIIKGNVISAAGQTLDSAEYNYDFDDNPGNDSYGWQFTTGANACQINFVRVEPNYQFFTRVGQSRDFTALPYDIAGNLLVAGSYNWQENQNLVNLINPSGSTISAVANNTNGDSTITVTASGPGSAISSANIRVFLCENPWPNPYDPINDTFPFDFNNAVHGFNFSSYYCQDSGRVGDPLLPYLTTNPVDQGGSGGLLREFIFVVDPQELSLNYNNILAKESKPSWWSKLFSRFKASALSVATAPTNLDLISNSSNAIMIGWQDNSSGAAAEDGFKIYRRTSITNWTEIAEVGENIEQFTDENVSGGQVYNYRVTAFIDHPAQTTESNPTNAITVTAGASSLDLIAIQVRSNPEHLSVSDWYSQYAPNPNETGQLSTVNGYEALQVGNTIYVSAANLSAPNIFTNIYIIAHNVGARESTVEIYNQLVGNLSFTNNVVNNNTCNVSANVSCSSDFDCPSGEYCQAWGDKLRRDTKRLTDLIATQRLLRNHGQLYKACSNSANLSCQTNSDCPAGGSCVPYYPLLNSGTYLSGTSISRWPSWREEFSARLFSGSLPVDPINRFNGDCPEGYDSATCWNSEESLFSCPAGSLIYAYQNNGGSDYELSANFESNFYTSYNLINTPMVNQPNNAISFNNNYICNGTPIGGNSVPVNQVCGNGIWEPSIGEECDVNSFRNLCDETVGYQNWWNERIGGCYPPGNPNQCQWYQPEVPLTPSICGGYCGDSTVQPANEICEGNGVVPGYSCVDGSQAICNGCQPICSGDGSLAIRCGDGIWDRARGEECDASASPNGLVGVSCTIATGTISCNDSCHYSCTEGEPYFGSCGNNTIEGDEQCEPGLYSTPQPIDSNSAVQYQCTNQCLIAGGWCGDGTTNRPFEGCDTNGWVTPSPVLSSATNQYVCDTCVNRGGWCGDRIVQNGTGGRLDWGEQCEDGDRVDGNVCSNGCQWNCQDTNNDSIPDQNVVQTLALFNGYTTEISLQNGQTAELNLPACRYRGNVLVDVVIDNGAGLYDTGILFVSDISGSMAGSPLANLKTAIAGTGNAIDSIYASNPLAYIGLISYNTVAVPLPGIFLPISSGGLRNILKNTVNNYTASGGTDHVVALQAALNMFNAGLDFENKIVVFMTDGGSASAAAINKAQELKTAGIDIFTVTLGSENGLLAFTNGLSSSACTCSGADCSNSVGSCGDSTTQCASASYTRFEECDGQAGCTNQCQWTDQSLKRAYQVTNANQLSSMYQYIVESISPGDISISINGTNIPIDDADGDNLVSNVVLPAASLLSAADCQAGVEHDVNINASISGNPNASIILSNPRFNFCPWENGDFY